MYEEHFGLARKPFQLSPDASFFFPSAEHKRALSFLQYGLNQGDGFIVITGNVGTGKTTLVQALLEDLDGSDLAVATLVTTNLREEELLQMVAEKFGVSTRETNKAALLKGIEHKFVQHARAGRRILLIVDEAQNLPPESVEELRMLSNFQIDSQPLVQIFLLGQQEFRKTLLSEGFEQLRQRVIATYHLNPLSKDETQTYIEHRLRVAGWESNPQFDASAFPSIFKFCEGVPRRINNLCDRVMLYAYLEELSVIDGTIVELVAAEIGGEFLGGAVVERAEPAPVFDSPAQPLESVARSVFEKADVQKRIAALERAVDSLGFSLKPELVEIREEIAFIRLMLEDLMERVPDQSSDTNGNKKSQVNGSP